MQLTDEQQRGIQAAWRVCMSQSKRVLQQRELALAELDMRGMSLQREGDFSLEMRKVCGAIVLALTLPSPALTLALTEVSTLALNSNATLTRSQPPRPSCAAGKIGVRDLEPTAGKGGISAACCGRRMVCLCRPFAANVHIPGRALPCLPVLIRRRAACSSEQSGRVNVAANTAKLDAEMVSRAARRRGRWTTAMLGPGEQHNGASALPHRFGSTGPCASCMLFVGLESAQRGVGRRCPRGLTS